MKNKNFKISLSKDTNKKEKFKLKEMGKLPDNTTVYLVDGEYIRDYINPSFGLGGHGYVYDNIPKNEIWIENSKSERDRSFTMFHEVFEYTIQKYTKYKYNEAHEHTLKLEELFRRIMVNICESEKIIFGSEKYQLYRCQREDEKELLEIINNISVEEKKFLAIDKKIDNIKRCIKDRRHLYLLKIDQKIIGFARESGRKNNGAQLEEIYIHPNFRNKGYSKLFINLLLNKFDYLTAKTFENNKSIASVLKSFNGKIVKKSPGGNIFYWELIK